MSTTARKAMQVFAAAVISLAGLVVGAFMAPADAVENGWECRPTSNGTFGCYDGPHDGCDIEDGGKSCHVYEM